MRNSRGEWEFREPSDRENYHFVRYTGLREHDFEDTVPSVWSEGKWIVGLMLFTIVFSIVLGIFLTWLMGLSNTYM